ncbi:MAG: hypothetical protein AB7E72_01530 [Lysobacterales bacterium]
MAESLAALFNLVRNKLELERVQKAFHLEQQRERAEERHVEEKRQDEANFEFFMHLTEVQRQMAELQERMARNFEILRGKFGVDVIGGMATTWLSPEEAAGLKTDDERMHALSMKFLNEDDSIKPPYEELVEAHYVQDWSKLGKLQLDKASVPELQIDRSDTRDPSPPNTMSKPLF